MKSKNRTIHPIGVCVALVTVALLSGSVSRAESPTTGVFAPTQSRLNEAVSAYTALFATEPADAGHLHRLRADAYAALGQYAAAISDYQDAIRLNHGDTAAANALARILATCPEQEYRNGAAAGVYARAACRLSHYENAYFLDTLAAACAQTGDYDDAVKLEVDALDSTRATPLSSDDADDARERLQLYRSQKPYRSPRVSVPAN